MKYLSILIFIFITSILAAQNSNTDQPTTDHFSCGQYPMTEAYFDAHPEERGPAMVAQASFELFVKQFSKVHPKDDEVLIIPVVFHVIHFNGSENISNDQIHSAIDVMNEDYSASNPGIEQVVQTFQDRVANVGVEFRLAKLDPDGNCTNGIVRVVNSATSSGGENLKQISPSWGRSKYLNIWVCSSIANGAAGYAFRPVDVNGTNGASADGILIKSNYVGRIGTGSPNLSHSLSHEAGHWLSLFHTWGPTNNPGVQSNCNVDDGIQDTPNTIGWDNVCDLQGVTCGSLDNVQNFMEYSYCDQMFTNGQKNVIRAALHSSIAQRNHLWSETNLIATGVLADDIVCKADFEIDGDPVVCTGQSVNFEDMSFNGPTSWSWTFQGGNPATSSQQNPEVTFSNPGTYSVTLVASNFASSASITKTEFVTVLALGENVLPFSEGFESFTSLENNDDHWIVINPDNSNVKWKLSSNVAYTGSKSIYVNGRQNSLNAVETLQSPTYDLSGLSNNAVLRFKFSHARKSIVSNDRLQIHISKNCGDFWSLRKTLNEDDLNTVTGNVTGEFVPQSQDEWSEVEISSISSVFLNDQFRFRFQFTSYAGNNLYIDDINLFDPSAVGLDEIKFVNYIEMYPNPTNIDVTFKYGMANSGDIRISVVDMMGRVVLQPVAGHKAAGEQIETIHTQSLSQGVYFVQLQSGGEQAVRKLIVQ